MPGTALLKTSWAVFRPSWNGAEPLNSLRRTAEGLKVMLVVPCDERAKQLLVQHDWRWESSLHELGPLLTPPSHPDLRRLSEGRISTPAPHAQQAPSPCPAQPCCKPGSIASRQYILRCFTAFSMTSAGVVLLQPPQVILTPQAERSQRHPCTPGRLPRHARHSPVASPAASLPDNTS